MFYADVQIALGNSVPKRSEQLPDQYYIITELQHDNSIDIIDSYFVLKLSFT